MEQTLQFFSSIIFQVLSPKKTTIFMFYKKAE